MKRASGYWFGTIFWIFFRHPVPNHLKPNSLAYQLHLCPGKVVVCQMRPHCMLRQPPLNRQVPAIWNRAKHRPAAKHLSYAKYATVTLRIWINYEITCNGCIRLRYVYWVYLDDPSRNNIFFCFYCRFTRRWSTIGRH